MGVVCPASEVPGHVLTPLPGGETHFERDSLVCWDEEGCLIAPERNRSKVEPVRDLDGGCLLVPGLVDVHVHLPQVLVRGRFQEALLPWLQEHIWPEEERFSDLGYREQVVYEFRTGLLRAGTTTAMVYGAPQADSAKAVLDGLSPLRAKGGDVLMDQNGPEGLLRDGENALQEAAAHVQVYGERYALTPRFAPSCSRGLLEGCGRLLSGTTARLQTHLAENKDEVAWVHDLFPQARSYTGLYADCGLLGPRSVFGHCIHVDDEDLGLLSRSGSWVAHCPTSNVALGSGRMPMERLLAAGVSVALATDVGAGPDLSMLDVMRSYLEVHQGFLPPDPGQALALASLAGAQSLGEGDRLGALVPGRQADLVALRIPGGLRRGESGEDALWRVLSEFRGRYEDAVAGVWIAGVRVSV